MPRTRRAWEVGPSAARAPPWGAPQLALCQIPSPEPPKIVKRRIGAARAHRGGVGAGGFRIERCVCDHPRQRPENPGRGSATIEARYPVAAHARGHNLEFRAPVQSHLVQGVGTTSSGRALRRTDVLRRSYSTVSSYSSSSASMLVAWRSPIDQRATIRMMLNPTYQSPF